MPDTAIIIDTAATYTMEIDTRLVVCDEDDPYEAVIPDNATVTVKAGRVTRIIFRGARVMPDGRPARDRGRITLTGVNLTGLGPTHKQLINLVINTATGRTR